MPSEIIELIILCLLNNKRSRENGVIAKKALE